MAWEQPGLTTTLVAASDLSAAQYTFVKIDSNGQAAAPAANGADAFGVVQNKPTAGVSGTVMYTGISKVVCAGNITRGARITCDAAGKAVAAATGNSILGTAEDTGANGRIIPVALLRGAGVV